MSISGLTSYAVGKKHKAIEQNRTSGIAGLFCKTESSNESMTGKTSVSKSATIPKLIS